MTEVQGGPLVIDYVGMRSLDDLCEEQARLYGPEVFITAVDQSGRTKSISYTEFAHLRLQLADDLSDIGVTLGTNVAVHLPNGIEFIVTWFALARLGAVMIPLNLAWTANEIDYALSFADCLHIVTAKKFQFQFDYGSRTVIGVDPRSRNDRFWHIPEGPPVHELSPGYHGLTSDHPRGQLRGAQPMEMVFTSGTTDRPKGVLTSHNQALRLGRRMSLHLAIRPDDVVFTAFPLYHVNAQSAVLMTLTSGCTLILGEHFSASQWLSQMQDWKVTVTYMIAATARMVMVQPEGENDRNNQLRAIVFAMNLAQDEWHAFETRFGVPLINCYGLSEDYAMITMAPLTGDRRIPSIGLPCVDRAVLILDNDGRSVQPGESGEICIAGRPGNTFMKEYYKDPQATNDAIGRGYLRTGDLGYMDSDGYLYFVDRSKDIIKVAGENVSSTEVEHVLLQHEAIAEAAVIGVADPIRDEVVSAFVVVRPEATVDGPTLEAFCRERLAVFKVPSMWTFCESLPHTGVGKIEKKLLREAAGSVSDAERTV